ncbi:MAG: hypothetical protein PHC75_02670 [Burkholderiales bacterium]|nr:hypothetical protein [Burkholderiales bacterium]
MKKTILGLFVILPVASYATGMAVGLDNLYFKNNNKTNEIVSISNLAENKSKFIIPSNSMCKINTKIMFLPSDYESASENNASYVISIKGNNYNNDIVMDKFGLSLAYDSFIKAPYSGDVKNFTFAGYCGSKYQQSRYLSVGDPENSDDMPEFKLSNCKESSNFIYTISKSYIKVAKKVPAANFKNIPECNLVSEESK